MWFDRLTSRGSTSSPTGARGTVWRSEAEPGREAVDNPTACSLRRQTVPPNRQLRVSDMELDLHQRIRQLLNERSIAYRTVHHEPTRTSEESARPRAEAVRVGGKALPTQPGPGFRPVGRGAGRTKGALGTGRRPAGFRRLPLRLAIARGWFRRGA